MKKVNLLLFILSLAIICYSCNNDNEEDDPGYRFKLEDLTLENLPVLDCSTSALPLQTLMACKLLDYPYMWQQALESNNTYRLVPNHLEIDDFDYGAFNERVRSSGTHGAYTSLIDKEADLILVARSASADEKEYAKAKGIGLEEKAVALDAFVFINNAKNPVKALTTKQVQDIYTGKTTNWKTLGGNDEEIIPYTRNANSGSQELMEELVMKGLEIPVWPEIQLGSMILPFTEIARQPNGMAYSVYYYKQYIVRDKETDYMRIDGVYPDSKTIKNKTYPYTTEVYAVIRKDLPKTSAAYRIYEMLSTGDGKKLIEESGYVAY